jgi:hypothetical protein
MPTPPHPPVEVAVQQHTCPHSSKPAGGALSVDRTQRNPHASYCIPAMWHSYNSTKRTHLLCFRCHCHGSAGCSLGVGLDLDFLHLCVPAHSETQGKQLVQCRHGSHGAHYGSHYGLHYKSQDDGCLHFGGSSWDSLCLGCCMIQARTVGCCWLSTFCPAGCCYLCQGDTAIAYRSGSSVDRENRWDTSMHPPLS